MAARFAIAVTVCVAVTVSVFPVAIAVTLTRVDAVDDDRDIDAAVLKVFDDATKDILVGDTLTHDEQVDIGMAHQQEGVGNQSQRRRVDDDVVVTFFQFLEEFVAFFGSDEFSGIGRDGAARDDIERGDLIGGLDDTV